METITWTVLPRGIINNNTARFGLMVSPRLNPDATDDTLSSFQMDGFAAKMQSASVQATVNGTTVPVHVDKGPLDPVLWDAIFPSTTLVRAFGFGDLRKRPIRSFSVKTLADYFDALYANVADNSYAGFPELKMGGPAGTLGHLLNLVQHVEEARRVIRKKLGKIGSNGGIDPERDLVDGYSFISDEAKELYWAWRFYDRPGDREEYGELNPALVPPPLEVHSFDFHEAIAMLGDFPDLLRRLGLLIDCTMPVPAADGTIAAVVNWGSGSATNKFPLTYFKSSSFQAVCRTDDQERGMLQLQDSSRYQVILGDVDGTTLKSVQYARGLVRMLGDQAKLDPPETQSLPARRTEGFSVIRCDRRTALMGHAVVAGDYDDSITNPNPSAVPAFYAEDLTRGYRVDVDHDGKWFSLCQRVGTCRVGAVGPMPLQDEGYIKAVSATSSPDPDGPPDLYLHESVFGWDGWSLCAARPGRTVGPVWDGDRDDTEPYGRVENKAATEFPLESDVRAKPGTLPPLRFGRKYRFRARTVDLGGYSLPVSTNDSTYATAKRSYLRHEPIASPVLLHRAKVTEGASLEHLVIRSDRGLSVAEYTSGSPHYDREVDERHAAPPKNTQWMAEAQGDFNGAFVPGADLAYYYRLGKREGGTFLDREVVRVDMDGYWDVSHDIELITPDLCPDGKRADLSTMNRGDPLGPGQYVIHMGSKAIVPYLPDSYAGGVAFHPQDPEVDSAYHEWQGQWPDLASLRICLTESGNKKVNISFQNNVCKFELPPATILKVRFASTPDASCLDKLAVPASMNLTEAKLKDIVQARNWLVTPWREMTFVHAVQRPLEKPELQQLNPKREGGQNFSTNYYEFTTHGQSTDKVDIVGEWSEYIDNLTEDIWRTQEVSCTAFSRPVGYADTLVSAEKGAEQPRHEFGDTKHRMVRYKAVGTTRYREYFNPEIWEDLSNITLAGPELLVDVPSSERPKSPDVLYAVPTFRWEEMSGSSKKRHGGGIRIYMNRPWFSSGEGELLGVVLAQGSLMDQHRHLVSHWGSDPIWKEKTLQPLSGSSFKNVAVTMQHVSLAEMEDMVVTVLGFPVHYHAERKLWYCDIEMDPGAGYFPFVKLALVRFQPSSIGKKHISEVVGSEFAQLLPDRAASVTVLSSAIRVTVAGPMGTNIIKDDSKPSREIRATLQRQTLASAGDLGWENVGYPVKLSPVILLPGASWEAMFSAPSGILEPLRILVEEYELFRTDPRDETSDHAPVPGGRLVYAETLPCPLVKRTRETAR